MVVKNMLVVLTGCLVQALAIRAAEPARKPNIMIIVVDDMGYSDPGCFGGEIQTPNLDKLASNGLRFTQFYNAGRCWPSRASILTGYYPQSVRRDYVSNYRKENAHGGNKASNLYGEGSEHQGGVSGIRPRWAQLLPVYLKSVGYRSYASGKWHVDGHALKNGFDHAYLFIKTQGFFNAINHTEDDVQLPIVEPDGKFYSTTVTSDYAIKYLKEHQEKYASQPFFQYLAFNAPHFPLHAWSEDIAIYKDRYLNGWDKLREERYERMKKMGIVDCELSPMDSLTIPRWNFPEDKLQESIGQKEVGYAYPWERLTAEQKAFQSAKMAVHAAMVHRIDVEIGRVLDQIKSMGELENTLIFFVSDNGASAEQIIRGRGHDPAAPIGSADTYLGIGPGWSTASNTPFRLHKSWNHEGGISTPLIVYWPDGIKARGELRSNPGHIIDLVPTVLDIVGNTVPDSVAGFQVPPLHGKSLVPAFTKDGSVKHDFIWWHHDGNRAIRVGDWKLVADHDAPWELYRIGRDRSETNNLAKTNPDKVKALEKLWIEKAEEYSHMAQDDPPAIQEKEGGE